MRKTSESESAQSGDQHDRALFLAVVIYVFLIPFEATKLLFGFAPDWLPSTAATGYTRISVIDGTRATSVVILLLIFRQLITQKKLRFSTDNITASLVALVAMLFASGFLAQWNSEYLLQFFRICSYFIPFYAVSLTINSVSRFKTLMLATVSGGIVIAAFGVVQYFTGFFLWFKRLGQLDVIRINSFVFDPNHLARYLTIFAIFAAVFWAQSQGRKRLSFAASILLFFVASLMTYSRNGLILWVFVASCFLLLAAQNSGSRFGLYAKRTLIISLPAIVLFLLSPLAANWTDRLQFDTFTFAHKTIRGDLLRISWQMFWDNPIFGAGFSNFPTEIYANYRHLLKVAYFHGDKLYTVLPQTSLLGIMAELGSIGLIWLAATVYSIWTAYRRLARYDHHNILIYDGILIAIMTLFLSSQGEGRLFDELYMWILLGSLVGLQRTLKKGTHSVDSSSNTASVA